MVQVPAAFMLAVVPETVQTLVVVEANVIVSPELAVALSGTEAPTTCPPIWGKLTACESRETATICETWAEA